MKTLLDYFDLIVSTPKGIPRLRKLVLRLAVQHETRA
jgi:hypothetical protein